MLLPLSAELSRKVPGTTFAQELKDSPQRQVRPCVDVSGTDHHQSPTPVVKLLAAGNVASPLGGVSRVLASVVLDEELELGVAEVEPHEHLAVDIANDEVDPRLRQTCEHDQHAQSGLHGGVDT